MKIKTIIFTIFACLLLTACSSSEPWVGVWTGDESATDGTTISIGSNGTVKLSSKISGDTYSISGTWTRVDSDERSIRIKYDPSTANIPISNPIAQAIVSQTLKFFIANAQVAEASEDGKHLAVSGLGTFSRR